jgi:hypothetical protein
MANLHRVEIRMPDKMYQEIKTFAQKYAMPMSQASMLCMRSGLGVIRILNDQDYRKLLELISDEYDAER